MDKATVVRKVILFSALAATVYVSIGTSDEAPVQVKIPTSETIQRPAVSVPGTMQVAEELGAESDGSDPFEPRNWVPAPPPPEPVKEVVAPPPIAPLTIPEGPPALPFQFMGRLKDGADEIVYLGRGDQPVVARAGEVLESTYKVISITPTQIEFEHLPTKQRQVLSMQSN
ncbi:hypothetical protein ACN9MU_15125 [Pseudoduganella sp. R-32]|uniref:hypothetical protein n=1 Tax=Pseudoduganella sp. R-32 TaxID=3404061 RepID=UPI003CF3EFEE